MVNRSFANLYFGGSQAIGRHLVQPGTMPAGVKFAALWVMHGDGGWTANRLPRSVLVRH
jgi:hypothetical protein